MNSFILTLSLSLPLSLTYSVFLSLSLSLSGSLNSSLSLPSLIYFFLFHPAVCYLVLDEADRMLDDGFEPAIRQVRTLSLFRSDD